MPSSTIRLTVTPKKPRAPEQVYVDPPSFSPRACKVCLGETWNNNYGVLSCPPCKSFFRRAIMMEKVYRCSKQQKCYDYTEKPIKNVKCRYCRLAKCFEVGMSPDNFRVGPDPKSSPKKIITEKDVISECYETLVSNCETVDGEIRRFKISEATSQKVKQKHQKLCFYKMEDKAKKKKELVTNLLGAIEYAKRFEFFHKISLDDRIRILAYFSMVFFNFEKSHGMRLENPKSSSITFDSFIKGKIDPFQYHIMKAICFFNPAIQGLSIPTQQLLEHNRQINFIFLADYCIKILQDPSQYYDIIGALSTLEVKQKIQKNIHDFPSRLSYDFVAQFKEELGF